MAAINRHLRHRRRERLERLERLEHLEHLRQHRRREHLEHLEHLERLERLERLEHLEHLRQHRKNSRGVIYGVYRHQEDIPRALKEEVNGLRNKRNVVIRCLVLLMMIAVFAGYASIAKSESTGEYVDDSVITTKVKALLANDDFLKSFQISVETQKGRRPTERFR